MSRRHHEPRVPVAVRGGIRAQTHRGTFGRQWWGRRWMSILEGFQLGARLGRGRNYAYTGQVTALRIEPGHVRAVVQGSSATAYEAEIRCDVLDAAGREKVLAELRRRHVLVARLLVRELPREIDGIFRDAGCPIFPERRTDLRTECTCPDWANPCKHVAAAYFLLTEAFDHDPLLLLRLRGIDRDDLLSQPARRRREHRAPPPPPAARPLQPDGFWGAPPPPLTDLGPAPATSVTAPLARRLGPLPFWRGEERFLDVVAVASGRAVRPGWQVWAGERPTRRENGHAAPGYAIRSGRPRMDVTMR